MAASLIRGQTVKFLEISDSVFFVALAVVGLVASTGTITWMEGWIGELSNIVLVVIAVGSIAVRKPFTLQYAREQTPEEEWDSPVFLRINYVITWVWAAAFIAAAVAGAFGNLVLGNDNNAWTAWTVQIAAIAAAIQFTAWYPDFATARYLEQNGLPTDPPPPVTDLLITLVGGLVTIGIVALVFDAGPWWVGVGFIVAGSSLGGQLRKMTSANSDAPAPAASTPGG